MTSILEHMWLVTNNIAIPAVMIVRKDTWQDAVGGRDQLTPPPQPVIAANGDELEVLGLGDVTLQVGGLETTYTVVVARGANFLNC